MTHPHASTGPGAVAIIGMSGRFPRARNVDELWRVLRDGVECVSFFSDEEVIAAGADPEAVKDPGYVKAAALVSDPEYFDAAFFGYTPREAEIMDPQHRLFLECAWEALESAGYRPDACPGRVGVYAGCSPPTYWMHHLSGNAEVARLASHYQVLLGNDKDYLATRVSYKLNLRGPGISVQTACSTSLVAVHLACQSILDGECDMALAGGATVSPLRQRGYVYRPEGIHSPDGHTRTFDARAQGCVPGSGVGVVVLKRLEDALADGDPVHAVIRGSAINNDGSAKVGFTAPSVEGQAGLITEALALAGVEPETISYVEAHGTATALGDPIEVAALTRAFRAGTDARGFCALGSIKTNMGHLNAAAGIAGLMKTVLALRNRMIPPSLHFQEPNPHLDLAGSPFYVASSLREWPENGAPRRAGVSSFGIGGTNAHVVLEEAPAVEIPSGGRPWSLLVLSARTEAALETATDNLLGHLREHPDTPLPNIAYTLQVGRRSFPHRRSLVCRTVEEAVAALEARSPEHLLTGEAAPQRTVAFLFPGQGAQHGGMAAGLYREEPVFREQVDRCAEVLLPHLGVDLRQVLFPVAGDVTGESPEIQETWLAQPALFVVEYALARLWMAWGVTPQAMLGHSLGEYVAACLSGVFSLEEALALVAARGRLMQQAPRGAMLAVPLPEDAVRPLLGESLSLAAGNGPSECVVSGPVEAVDDLQERLARLGTSCRRLTTSHAFHSALMEPVLGPFLEEVKRIRLQPPRLPFISNVTGTWIRPGEATDPAYWVRHLRETVRFSEGLRLLAEEPGRALLEVGPGRTLGTLARRQLRQLGSTVVSSLPHRSADASDLQSLLSAVGTLWMAGVEIDWAGLHAGEPCRRVPLPTYPFERQYYWIPPPRPGARAGHPAADGEGRSSWLTTPSWTRAAPRAPVRADDLARHPRAWLVLADGRGLGAAVAELLESAGHRVIRVSPGETFRSPGDGSYVIRPGEAGDYDSLLDELAARGDVPDAVLHLWSVAAEVEPGRETEAFQEMYSLGPSSVVHLSGALSRCSGGIPVQGWIVSDRARVVTGDERVRPEGALALAACGTLGEVAWRGIDVAVGDAGAEALARQLLAEVLAEKPEPLVALRGRYAWVPGETEVPLPGGTADEGEERGSPVYLIANGLGRTGLEVAGHLAPHGRPTLVLADPAPLPPRSDWPRWLQESPSRSDDGGSTAAEPLPLLWEEEDARIREAEAGLARERAGARSDRQEEAAEAAKPLCAAYICEHLASGGVRFERGAVHDEAEVRRALGILPKFEKFFDFMLDALAEDGIVRREGERFEVLRDAHEIPEADALRQRLAAAYPEHADRLDALEQSVRHYPAALSGRIEAISLLYPEGRPKEVPVEESSSFADANLYIAVTAEWLAGLARRLAPRKLKLLEVGAGNGRLTWPLAAALQGQDVEYHFTDLGRAFVLGAEKRAAEQGLDFMHFGTLDISRDPAAQGYGEHRFDVILAFNVVHATGDVAATLENLRRLLVPGGILLLLELTRVPRWTTLRVGVAEGFWYFEDRELRQRSPLLEAEQWERVFRDRGFAGVSVYPCDPGRRAESNHVLVLGREPEDRAAEAETRRRVWGVCALEELGAEVVVTRTECTDPGRMEDLLREVEERFGSPDGVVFAAPDGSAPGTALEDVLRRGVRGVLALESAVRQRAHGLRLLATSAAGTGEGLPARALQEYLDGFAVDRTGRDAGPWVSVRWQVDGGSGADAARAGEAGRVLRGLVSPGAPPLVTVSRPTGTPAPAASPDRLEPETPGRSGNGAPARSSLHARPPLPNPYVAPRNPTEEQLVRIWEDALGLSPVGAYDDFYALGGDSLLSLQISSLARQAGIEILPQQILEHPTIAALAPRVRAATAVQAEQGVVSGPVPLTPPQRALLDMDPPNPHHYNTAGLHEVRQRLSPGAWREAVRALLLHHDALRLRFVREAGRWRQFIALPDGSVPFGWIDLSALPPGVQRPTLEAATATLQTSLNLSTGPIVRVAYFDLGPEQPGRLLLLVHHFAMDRVSAQILREDLERACGQLQRGDPVLLPPKTTSYKEWVERLARYARSEPMQREWAYWLDDAWTRVPKVPVDFPGAENTLRSIRYVVREFDKEETRRLLHDVPQRYGASMRGMLLTALVRAFERWTGAPTLLVGLADHGRRELFDGVDVSRTIGLLSTGFPVRLTVESGGPAAAIRSVEAQLEGVPSWGLGYGLLAYLSGESDPALRLRSLLSRVQVHFNYVGRTDQTVAESPLLRPAEESTGSVFSPDGTRPHLLWLGAWIKGERLRLICEYSENLHRSTTIERRMDDFADAVRWVLRGEPEPGGSPEEEPVCMPAV
ncbi:MAG TPA: beta-ketoacyl synthase N-terminal-like domain-containing protein [Longimicrobiaceae bacterium]|nr:beta-ketoacyl synthase N-terminal-like domain-containing protein [Longimicrobiaceae bacterium]